MEIDAALSLGRMSSRRSSALLFAAVALLAAIPLVFLLSVLFRGPYCGTCTPHDDRYEFALPLPLLAAALAYAWAWLLHPRREVHRVGAFRGTLISALALVSFFVILSGYVQWVMPAQAYPPRYSEPLELLIGGMVLTVYPWLLLLCGALAGMVDLGRLRALHVPQAAVFTQARKVCRSAFGKASEPWAEGGRLPLVTRLVVACWMLAAGALCLRWIDEPGLAGTPSLGPVSALSLLIASWLAARLVVRVTPARHRLTLLSASLVAALAACSRALPLLAFL